MDKKIEIKVLFLIASLSLMLLIIFWPIYFFVFSGLDLIVLGLNELIFFGFIELILLIVLFGFWQVYSRYISKK